MGGWVWNITRPKVITGYFCLTGYWEEENCNLICRYQIKEWCLPFRAFYTVYHLTQQHYTPAVAAPSEKKASKRVISQSKHYQPAAVTVAHLIQGQYPFPCYSTNTATHTKVKDTQYSSIIIGLIWVLFILPISVDRISWGDCCCHHLFCKYLRVAKKEFLAHGDGNWNPISRDKFPAGLISHRHLPQSTTLVSRR